MTTPNDERPEPDEHGEAGSDHGSHEPGAAHDADDQSSDGIPGLGVHPGFDSTPAGGTRREYAQGGGDGEAASEVARQDDSAASSTGEPAHALELDPVHDLGLPEGTPPELAAALSLVLQRSSSWSGMLPPPDDFARYEPDVRERMMRWNDATTIDESARQDKLVAAEIAEAQRSPRRSFAVIVLAMLAALASEALLDSTPLALAFVAAPVLAYATSAITRVFSKSSRPPSDRAEK